MVQNIFLSGIFQIYLVFISAEKYIEYFKGTIRLYLCKSSGISEENIENITRSDSRFDPTFFNHYILPEVNFNGHCLMNKKISIPKKVIYIYTYKAATA